MRLPLTALVSGLVFANGCVEEDAAMFIQGALPLLPQDCEVSSADNVFLPSGTLDLGTGKGYTSFLKVLTNLPATFNNQDVVGDGTRSPNFPDYGAVDNNVVIFQTASIDFELKGAVEATDLLEIASAGALTCQGGSCTSNADNEAGKREEVPAAGTLFNTQTTLNSAQVVVTEAISSSTASALLGIFTQAATDASLLAGDGTIANPDGAQLTNLLVLPSQTQRLTMNISLTGATTGSGDLRPVRSAVFPFGIDVCIGCLSPDAAYCRKFDAVVLEVDNDPCIVGQDIATAVCACPDALTGLGDPARKVTNDSEICRTAP
jgi:hypothetical protein